MLIDTNCSCSVFLGQETETRISIVRLFGNKCGDIVVFECAMGYYLTDGGQQRSSVCLDGKWTAVSFSCQGKLCPHNYSMH